MMALAIVGISVTMLLLGGMVTLLAVVMFGANSKLRKSRKNDNNPER